MSDDDAEAAMLALAADVVSDIVSARIVEMTGGLSVPAGAPEPEPAPQQAATPWNFCVHCGGVGGHLQPHDHWGRYTGHLQNRQPRPFYYSGPGHVPMALYGPEPAQEAQGGQQGTDATEAELEARGMYEAARGATEAPGADVPLQQAAEPAGGTARPARQRPPRGRYGRRRTARRGGGTSPWHPGSGGADTGGATGGASET